MKAIATNAIILKQKTGSEALFTVANNILDAGTRTLAIALTDISYVNCIGNQAHNIVAAGGLQDVFAVDTGVTVTFAMVIGNVLDAGNGINNGGTITTLYEELNSWNDRPVRSGGTTGGTGSAGAGNQYVEMTIDGTTYKVLHDGTV